MDRNSTRPYPVFTPEEAQYLQALLDGERSDWFDWKMELLESGRDATGADQTYQLAKSCRNKIYHLSGRDTLALGEPAEQRHWDQPHDY